jgi:hypothetical protein
MRLHRPISAIVLGNHRDVHFRGAIDWLVGNVACRFFDDATAAMSATDELGEPSLVVLLQSRPGEFTETELAALRRRWPLARFVAVAGSWCEGEPRSGFATAGVYRIGSQAAVERLAIEIGESPTGRAGLAPTNVRGLFDLPATATADERLLANARPMAATPAVVAVAARRLSWAEPLVDALAAAGHAAVYWPLDGGALARGIDATVWDTFGCDRHLEDDRRALATASGDAPLVAVADFPRPQDVARLAALGVRRVFGKPLLVADLLACLDALVASRVVARPLPSAVA